MIPIIAGSTSQTIDVFLPDNTSTTGAGKTGLVASGLTAYYRKGINGAATAISLSDIALATGHTAGGLEEIEATNMPGMYRLDLPDAMVDTEGFVTLMVKGSAIATTTVRIDCRRNPAHPVGIKSLGTVKPGSTICIPFETFSATDGKPITITGFATSDIQVYKGDNNVQRASASGYTLMDTDGVDIDGITGIHGFFIDLSDNTTADFWSAGSSYTVVINAIVAGGQSMSFVAGTFRIGIPGAFLDTTIATLSSQTSFTLTAGPAEDDALNGCYLVIHDAASAVQEAVVQVLDYTGSTKTVTLVAAPTFTIAAKDNVSVMANKNLLDTEVDSSGTPVTMKKALEMLAAFMAGQVTVSSLAGVSTYTYKKRDGSTTSFTSLCSETNGTRASTGALS